MKQSRRLWAPALVALAVTALIGLPTGGDQVAAAGDARTIVANLMIPAGAFSPATDDVDFSNYGTRVRTITGSGTFVAPITFPVPEVRIRRITLYALDIPAQAVAVELYRTSPATGSYVISGAVIGTGGFGASTTTDIAPRLVKTAIHGAHLELYLSDPAAEAYGIKVTYAYETSG
ncbi:MAG: hypothetical protein ABIJ48_04510 [Actinomycetota bacterium]